MPKAELFVKSYLPHLILTLIITLVSSILIFGTTTPEPITVTSILPTQVHNLTLIRPEHPALAFNHDEKSEWWMQHPLSLPARNFRLHQIVNIVTAISHAQFPLESINPRHLGLQPPAAEWRINDMPLLFGDLEPLSGQRYLQVGRTIHLIKAQYLHHALKPMTDFISLALLPPSSTLNEVILPRAHLKLRQQRWQVLSDLTDRLAQTDQINVFIGNWENAQALDVLPYQTIEAPVRIELRTMQSVPIIFEYIDEAAGAILARPEAGVMYRLSDEQATTLLLR